MLTRSILPQHSTLPQLPPFSIDPSLQCSAHMVSVDTFWRGLASAGAGYIGNSVSGKVQILIPSKVNI